MTINNTMKLFEQVEEFKSIAEQGNFSVYAHEFNKLLQKEATTHNIEELRKLIAKFKTELENKGKKVYLDVQ